MNLLSFSTLGCPAWTLERIIEAAREYGYDALELRGLQDEMDLPLAAPFLPANRKESHRRITDAGLQVCCVDSSGVVAKGNLDHVKAHAELARDLGSPFVRVFGGELPSDVPRATAIERAAATLRDFGDAAQQAGVCIVLETHDAFSMGRCVAELLDAAQHPAVFALWDLHHPFRQGESLPETYGFLKDSVRHTHVKDSRNGAYTLMGEGDVPLLPMLDLLLDGGYDSPISLEWEKRWKPELPEPEVALPQCAAVLRAYLDARGQRAIPAPPAANTHDSRSE